MLNDRIAAAKEVQTALIALEAAIDEALSCAAAMTIALPAARKRAKVSAVVGQEVTQLTSEALTALFNARASIVAAHHGLAEVRDEMGLRTYAGGALWKIVNENTRKTQLKVVSENAA
jgi:D-arabinose 5-phosphate isomerase GutQ